MNPEERGVTMSLVGREEQLSALGSFLASEMTQRALVLIGEAGIGKTAIWEAGVELAREQGYRVLSARGGEAETGLSFACLADLFSGVEPDELAGLPAPQLSALNVALQRAEAADEPPQALAISTGFLNSLRLLGRLQPRIMIAIDEIASIDSASSGALVFVARRLEGTGTRFLLTRRSGRPTHLERALETTAVRQLAIGPLSLGAITVLLTRELGQPIHRPLLRRVFETSGGNPLFALELGRTLLGEQPPEIGDALPLPELLEDLFGTQIAQLTAPLRRCLLAVALSPGLTESELASVVGPFAVEDAVSAGLLLAERSRLRPRHPLLATTAARHSAARERRSLHKDLAVAVVDPTLRARHQALAASGPNGELAAAIAEAADAASRRGAMDDAVELAAHALRLTPAVASERADRILVLAVHLHAVGDLSRVRALLTTELDNLPPGRARATAHLLLGADPGEAQVTRAHLELAIRESAHEPDLRSVALARISVHQALNLVQRLAEAEAMASDALQSAGSVDPAIEQGALDALAWIRVLRGRPIDDLLERWPASELRPSLAETLIERPAGVRHAFRGCVAEARAVFQRQLSIADERGDVRIGTRLHLQMCELALRGGDAAEASRLIDEWDHWIVQDEMATRFMKIRLRALLAALVGDSALARRLASEVADSAAATRDDVWSWLEAKRARGVAALFERDIDSAIEDLAAVWEHTLREGVDDPGAFPVAPDLAEALIAAGDVDAAHQVTDRLASRAAEQDHPWGLATAKRCDAMLRLVRHYDDHAAGVLKEAADDYGRLGLRFDSARSLLFLGQLQRRFKKRSEARQSLDEAARAFEEMGCAGWAERARAELARVSGRRTANVGELTATEQRVAKLAASGLSNKEIASRLFVTVDTVEVHLTHIYAKLGLRSRAQLASWLAST